MDPIVSFHLTLLVARAPTFTRTKLMPMHHLSSESTHRLHTEWQFTPYDMFDKGLFLRLNKMKNDDPFVKKKAGSAVKLSCFA